MENKYNIDEIIYEARIGIAKDFAQKFYVSALDENQEEARKQSSKNLAKLLHDRKKVLDGDVETAKKYVK